MNYHYLERGEGRYRVVEQAPTRAPIERQEIPDWEAVWLPEFLAGTHLLADSVRCGRTTLPRMVKALSWPMSVRVLVPRAVLRVKAEFDLPAPSASPVPRLLRT